MVVEVSIVVYERCVLRKIIVYEKIQEFIMNVDLNIINVAVLKRLNDKPQMFKLIFDDWEEKFDKADPRGKLLVGEKRRGLPQIFVVMVLKRRE